MAPHGMVATSHPLAAEAGVAMLKRGGTAVDAAIAANAVLGVVEPMSCGIGGDLFCILWDNARQQLFGLNASGRAPYAASLEHYQQLGLQEVPLHGPLSWSVPGCVDGWEALHRKLGTFGLGTLLAPAIDYAQNGFPVTEVIARYWHEAAAMLAASGGTSESFLKDGRTPVAGERMTNRALARSYKLLADEGRDGFYQGTLAAQMVRFSESVGGLLSLKDLADHHSDWVDPISSTYRGFAVWEMPPNGQGMAVLQILNVLESADVANLGHNSAEFLHLFIEAKKLAYADRAAYYADPDFAEVPVQELISKAYADRQRRRIDPRRAAQVVPAGDIKLGRSDTIYLTAADSAGNAVSLIQSNYVGFGSGLAPDGLGFVLQNRGNLFALDPKHPNRLEPHKRPFHTIIPAMVTRAGKPWLSFGVMGGDMQPQGQVQVLCNLIDHHMNLQQAGDADRCQHQGSSTPTGRIMNDGGKVIVEPGLADKVVEQLRALGHKVSRGTSGFGGYQAILIDAANRMLQGASETRTDGAAIGY